MGGVNKGDVLIIPAPNDKNKNDDKKMKIHWQQSWRQRDGDYYVLVAKNKSQSKPSPTISNPTCLMFGSFVQTMPRSHSTSNRIGITSKALTARIICGESIMVRPAGEADGCNRLRQLDWIDNYEITIDDRHQYGSSNVWGQNQFVVWHDKDRKPYAVSLSL